jgi:hypothetical protein
MHSALERTYAQHHQVGLFVTMQPIIATTMAYAAFDRLLSIWNPHNLPRPKSFLPFFFSEWLSSLHHAKDDFQKELRDNWIKFDEGNKIDYLEEMRTQLDAVIDAVASLPTVKPIKLQQVLKRNKHFPHSDAYKRLIDPLGVREQEASSPQRDESAARPFQNEAIQADFFEVYQFLAQRLAAVKRESPSTLPTGKKQPERKPQPLITWHAQPKDLADLLFTLEAKKHLTLNVTNKNALSRAITSLFQLPHDTPVISQDWKILANYLGTEIIGNPQAKTKTKIRRKQTKNSLYEGIKGFEEQ